MSKLAPQTSAAFHELMDLLKGADANFTEGFRAVGDEISEIEGYRWLTEILSVALDCFVWADAARPQMVSLVGPTRKFGGDNADALYHYSALDPQRSYVLRGRRTDAVYVSITIYGGPDDGRWSNRIVATVNDRDLTFAPDGSFEIELRAMPPGGGTAVDASPGGVHASPGRPVVQLEADAVCVVTRDYHADPFSRRPTEWSIEALEASPAPRLTDAAMAARFRATANFLRELTGLCPLPYDESKWNTVDDPWPVPAVTYGWAAGDASYAMGAFRLEADEALVMEGRSPKCAFWNLCLWNPYLQTYDYRYEPVTINGEQCRLEADGSWRIVIAAKDPGVANWVSTAGHERGRIWFRWFLADELPPRPTTRLVKLNRGQTP
jgi:hypothetical protein